MKVLCPATGLLQRDRAGTARVSDQRKSRTLRWPFKGSEKWGAAPHQRSPLHLDPAGSGCPNTCSPGLTHPLPTPGSPHPK